MADAIARVKAKKAAQQSTDVVAPVAPPTPTAEAVDARKAAVADAIARIKAKKAAQAQMMSHEE